METSVSHQAYEASRLDDSETHKMLSKTYPYTILITEDDDEVRCFLERELSPHFKTRTAANGKDALRVLEEEEISLVVSDVMMPEMNGFELCRMIKSQLPFSHIPVILLTALTDERQRIFGITGGADDYIQRSCGIISSFCPSRRRWRASMTPFCVSSRNRSRPFTRTPNIMWRN